MRKRLKVAITAPHAACPPVADAHVCDRASEGAARAISAGLPGSRLLVARVHRDPTQLAADGEPGRDENRLRAAKDTPFQRALDEALSERPFLVIDVHSFDEGAFHGLDVAVLDPARPRWGWSDAASSLRDRLEWAGLRSGLVTAGRENAIVARAVAGGAEAAIVEFGEHLSREKTEVAVAAVVAWARERTQAATLM